MLWKKPTWRYGTTRGKTVSGRHRNARVIGTAASLSQTITFSVLSWAVILGPATAEP
ncbi:hypothetical protein N1027_12720 [Herbiconiux sp. CPCC 205763]|uniref:Uncharacterized protein n=1 Tax=Herbiconiux aconitum TaxID=2970913 RepID=A0ABT2GS58_9MICO|nr:hypothetical protein [Herbiconiux aconitum]MCS5718998.1 hypothetical protein [Herbiconiux aconitum]